MNTNELAFKTAYFGKNKMYSHTKANTIFIP